LWGVQSWLQPAFQPAWARFDGQPFERFAAWIRVPCDVVVQIDGNLHSFVTRKPLFRSSATALFANSSKLPSSER
jgi:hypothetical protein